MNLHDEMDLQGCYYGEQMEAARKTGRIGDYPPDESVSTYTVWDLGVDDDTAIIWVQKIGTEIRHICSYVNHSYSEGRRQGTGPRLCRPLLAA